MTTRPVIVTPKSENWSQFFGLQPKTGVKIQHFDPNTIRGKMTAKFYDVKNNIGESLVGRNKLNDMQRKERKKIFNAFQKKFQDAFNKDIDNPEDHLDIKDDPMQNNEEDHLDIKDDPMQNNEEDHLDIKDDPMQNNEEDHLDIKDDPMQNNEEDHLDPHPAENQSIQNFSFKITNPPAEEFSTDSESGNTSLLLPSIERLNNDTTEKNKELKVQSQNWSEFFGLKTKTGVTTRMFGSNTTWGKITALFCLDSTNRVKDMVVDEFNKQCNEKINLLKNPDLKKELNENNLSASLKEKLNNKDQNDKLTPLTPAAVINLLKPESEILDTKLQHSTASNTTSSPNALY